MSIVQDGGTAGDGSGLTPAQKRALLARLMADGKVRATPEAESFLVLFERQAARTPEAPALAMGGEVLTYGELDAGASEWAEGLRAYGVRPGATVGLSMARGVGCIAALIGILKAGCAYLPLEPDDAPVRLDVLRGHAHFVLTEDGATVLGDAAPIPLDIPFAWLAGDRTPRPVTQRAVAARLAWLRKAFSLGPDDISLFACSLHDISAVTSLFWPLTMGSKVMLAVGDACPRALAALTNNERISLAVLPVGVLPWLSASDLRLLFLDRDPPSPMTALSAVSVFVLWQFAEAGGPVLAQPVGEGAPLVGAPVQILDRHGQPAPSGAVGTLSLSLVPGAAPLLVGARARLRADGRFERRPEVGRGVAVGGLRFGLTSLEAALRGAPGIADCHVLLRDDVQGVPCLVAYVVPDGYPAPEAWSLHAEKTLPFWQRPEAWVSVAALPLTDAGTLDEQALAGLPVLDGAIAEAWRLRLEQLGGVAEAAVVPQMRPATAGVVSLPVAPPLTLPMPVAAAPEAERTDGPQALVDGGPLVLPPDAPRTLTAALLHTAAKAGGKGILFHGANGPADHLEYAALLREALHIAGGLVAAGLRAGDKAILQVPEMRAHLPAFWGCVLAGGQPVTVAVSATFDARTALVSKLLNAWELLGHPVVLAPAALAGPLAGLQSISATAPTVLVLEQLAAHAALETVHPAAPDDVLFLQLSSGSTGTPKCIQITHRGVVDHVHATVGVNGYASDDVSLNWLPMDHVVPMLTWHLRDVYLGCAQIEVETAAVLANPLLWLDLIEQHGVTRSWSPNFGFKLVSDALLSAPRRTWTLHGLKTLMNAGEQATIPVIAEFLSLTQAFGIRPEVMQPAFGMAEACTCMTYETGFDPRHSVHWIDKASLGGRLRPVAAKAAEAVGFVKLGPPVSGVAIRIVDAANALVREGVIGRFQIKGSVITPGYFNNDEANRDAFVGGGWFNSGDLGFILDGNLTLTGREKEMIIVNGANFYCYEIEDLVNAVPGVQPTFAAACSVPSDATGSEVLALFFSHRPGADADGVADAVRAAVTTRLGLAPAYVTAIPQADFPKTTSGKIQRMQLRGQLMAQLNALANAREVPAWFHREIWVRRDLGSGPAAPCALALLGGPEEVRTQLAQALEHAGIAVVQAQADAGGDASRLLEPLWQQGVPLDAVVDLRLLASVPESETPKDVQARAGAELSHALALLKGTAAKVAGEASPLVLTFVTLAGAGSTDPADPARAALRGLLRTAGQEMPGLACRLVDITGAFNADMMSRLAQEIAAPDGEAEVALRPAARFVPRLEAMDPGLPSLRTPIRLRMEGRYLVTGGLGGIGRELVRHLSTRCAAKILVVGRATASSEGLAALAVMAPHSLYRAADVTDPGLLEAAIGEAEARFGGPLDGVFHLAGTPAAGRLADETPERLAAVFAPKAVGAKAIFEVMARRPGGFVVLWSSVNAIFGGAEAGAYAAANAALAGMEAGGAVRTLCLHWSRWQNIGMSAPAGSGMGPAEFAAARGFRTLPVGEALASLDAALAMGVSPLCIGLDGGHANVRARVRQPATALFGLSAFVVPRAGAVLSAPANDDVRDRFGTPAPCTVRAVDALPRTGDGSIDAAALAGQDGRVLATGTRNRSAVEDKLAAVWSELLNRPHIAPDDNFFMSGGHSLIAARLVFRVRETFGVDLPLRILFETPTLAGMAGWIDAHAPAGAGTRQIPDCLVAVQPEGNKVPLFCVHPAGGSPWCYLFLANHLGLEQPLYGFQAPGLLGDTAPLTSVEEMARLYVDAMRVRQPLGPYRIAAWSSGGPVAFEMARQLEAAGEGAETLAFFDCALMESENFVRSRDPLRHGKALWRMGTFLTQVRVPRSYIELTALARLIGLSLPASFRDLRLDRAFWAEVGRSMRIFNLNTTMGYRYNPSRISGRAVLFRAGSGRGADDPLEAELRQYVSGGVARIDLEGNHMSIILDTEGAADLAAQLTLFLDGEATESRTKPVRRQQVHPHG